MKIINRLILGLAVVAGITTSCKEDDDLNIPGGLSLDVEEITVGPEKSFKEIMVKADVNWQASSSTPWISISPANGTGSATCVLNIDSTLTYTARTAQVRFNPAGNTPKILKVTQFGFGKQIILDKPEVELENSDIEDNRYFDVTISTNVQFAIESVNYSFAEEVPAEDEAGMSESDKANWLTLPKESDLNVNLDRGSRPRSVKTRFKWEMNAVPYTRVATIKLVAKNSEDQLIDSDGNEIDGVYLTVTQKPAMKIEDNRAGDSISIVLINQKLQCMYALDVSENMQNWTDVTLWEETDEDLPEEAAVGRVRSLSIAMIDTKETLPQEIKNLKYLESFHVQSNANRQDREIVLGPEICELKYLKKLSITSYGLVELPEEFVKLGGTVDKSYVGLEELGLESNNFASLSQITDLVNKENFPKLKYLRLSGCRRTDTLLDMSQMEGGNTWKGIHIGMYINLNKANDKNEFMKLLEWDTLKQLELSYGFIEGELPTDEEMMAKFGNYSQYASKHPDADVCTLLTDTCQWLKTSDKAVTVKYDGGEFSVKGSDVPCVLPNTQVLYLNLNFLTGKVPNWILFHPHLIDWYPESMVFTQEEGKNSNGEVVGFSNVPMDFEYFYGKIANDQNAAFPKYYGKYVMEEETAGE
ncbi:BACON domain-containing protein [Phocaeicola sp.]|uniref:BACON domain-containing protein n=1 Tax=Phocaeicola sp. TaxID=2773926 RepID=UPI003AB131FF